MYEQSKGSKLAEGKQSDRKTNRNFKDWWECRQSVVLWLKVEMQQWWARSQRNT